MTQLSHDQRLVSEQLTTPFVGLTADDTDAVDLPSGVKRKIGIGENPDSFADIVDLLPNAQSGALRSKNPFVNDDGTLDVEAMHAVDGVDIDAAAAPLDTSLDAIDDAPEYLPVHGAQEIIDPRRAAIAVIPAYRHVKYQWQIASNQYAIINPGDIYDAAIQTFADFDEGAEMFGWLSWRDYGGTVDMFILFADETVETPDGFDQPFYLGYHTGYGFKSQRKLFVDHFAFHPEGEDRGAFFYEVGTSHSRKHLGDPTNSLHEKKNDRKPLSQWWVDGHKEFLRDTELTTKVRDSTSVTVDFATYPFDLAEYYQLLQIPQTTAEAAASRVARQTDPTEPSMWSIGINLALTLASRFSGHKAGAQFRAQSRVATKHINTPHSVLRMAIREYNKSGLPTDGDDDEGIGDDHPKIKAMLSQIDSVDDLEDLDGVNVTDLSADSKQTLTEQTNQVLLEEL